MFILTKEGKLIEGQELTAAEVELIPQIIEGMREASEAYLPESSARKITRFLLEEYYIVRRKLPTPEPAPEAYPAWSVAAPAMPEAVGIADLIPPPTVVVSADDDTDKPF